ncbi:MAG: dihydroneopterin aldolase [Sphingomonadaceae bacterium]|nr:MAG: dihydroneopterin aldolase [Sphingomonadaceae bacterium]
MNERSDDLPRLPIRSRKISLVNLEVEADIGFHDHEIGKPQRLLISVDIWLDDATDPVADEREAAWDYDFIRSEILRIATARRFNLQETLVREIFDRIGSVVGVNALTVRSRKPDIYADAEAVGIEFSSFV